MSQDTINSIREIAAEVSQREGCLLYDLQFLGGSQRRVLRVFIDRQEGEVSIEDCANVSRGLSLLLDVKNLVEGNAYDLEVSSPGLERHLKETWHFQKVLGQTIKILTKEPVFQMSSDLQLDKDLNHQMKKNGAAESSCSLEGCLTTVSDHKLVINQGELVWEIPREVIRQAKVKFIFGKKSSDKPYKKKKR